MNNYSAFICSGKGKDRRESGSYSTAGNTYLDAVIKLAQHWNNVMRYLKFGDNWRYVGRRDGMPRSHAYFKDERGNELLLVKRS
jgi:hypothetical protein